MTDQSLDPDQKEFFCTCGYVTRTWRKIDKIRCSKCHKTVRLQSYQDRRLKQ